MRISSRVVQDFDWSRFEEIRDSVEVLQKVRIGVPDGAGSDPNGTPLALVAAVHEFGAPSVGVPERSFLRRTIRENQEKYVRLARINLVKVTRNMLTMQQALGQLGEVAKADVQAFMASNDYVLADSTIARKGSSRALIDTGNLRQSITWTIE